MTLMESAYSGMTPGYIQNFYKIKDYQLIYKDFALMQGATFINDEVIQI